MNVMRIEGGRPLQGTVRTQGAKNAALPVMAACLLLKGGALTLANVPELYDVSTMMELLTALGVTARREGKEVTLGVADEVSWEAPESLVRKMRASSLVLGPLLARCGRAALPLPGGCSIGSRPIDLHLKGLVQMGAKIEIRNGVVCAQADRLRGRRIYLDFPSVGATENLMMAAALAQGETIIENIAREPEIDNLAAVLRSMGVPIDMEGTGCVRIKGVEEVRSCRERVIPDRIEACTYLLAGVMTGGRVTVEDAIPAHIDSLLAKLEEAGVRFAVNGSAVTVFPADRLQSVSLKTMPFPGFPTDLQPQMAAALSLAEGTSVIEESVFQARFLYAAELNRMGADIRVKGDTAVISGVERLSGANVKATDLRAGAALIIAGLAAQGRTQVEDMVHVWRGYEAIDVKLRSLGAQVELAEDVR
ncbi:UDP-N-acetylglucosamine 1-carboxyvinyltransferase [Fretibacterium fastidiosum]|uniref:UDP-N-acetylglucosamine 1-carboxyvinyltransferase n=1 Tax=Fretibacterium fastidiosum TaxID=651822 RepID=A0AB94IX91_9BACT|nr:UDP-N-acetylglucosamine 1-carboxyvinyltransferase [Fretibacterium fastidiosum]CBL28304.1 UDP-N-acetylglucosamine 1-carboxyvinyltransferase [Fretibacterium fastidiosum]